MALFYGKTVEEAIENALKELNINKDQAIIEVLEEPQKGFLGIGTKEAKVKVEKKQDDGERAAEFLSGIFEYLKVPATTEILENGDRIVIDILTTSPTAIIGYRGEVLDALQTLASASANLGNENYKKVVVNCENYREKREETLKNLAIRIAEKALKYQKKFSLEPMNPFERKIIHSALMDNEHVQTISEGVEPNRYVVVCPDNCKDDEAQSYNRKKTGRPSKQQNRGKKQEKSEVIKLEKKTIGFGTYLGNSQK